MIISQWLNNSTKFLADASISSARLDCEVLLANALDKDRSWLHGNSDTELSSFIIENLDKSIIRRSKHEPISYILGKKEFYGREFAVTANTLQPRPETETMVELLLKLAEDSRFDMQNYNVIDVGTGSGCVAITVKLELKDSNVMACDISKKSLEVASKNADKLSANVKFIESDLIVDFDVKDLENSILCCNLPYVPDEYEVNQSAKFEPNIALFGGIDGLDYFRQLFEQIVSLPVQFRPKIVLTESLEPQHESLAGIAEAHNYSLVTAKDLIQVYQYS